MSNKFKLESVDWKKIGKGAMIALGGALLTYLADTIPTINLSPEIKPLVVALFSVLINAGRKLIKDNN